MLPQPSLILFDWLREVNATFILWIGSGMSLLFSSIISFPYRLKEWGRDKREETENRRLLGWNGKPWPTNNSRLSAHSWKEWDLGMSVDRVLTGQPRQHHSFLSRVTCRGWALTYSTAINSGSPIWIGIGLRPCPNSIGLQELTCLLAIS